MTELLPENVLLARDIALFLDFDGTLVGFQDDPDLVQLRKEDIALLMKLNKRLEGALAIISGRDLRDLSKRIPIDLWRLGNHGLYFAGPHETPPDSFANFPDSMGQKVKDALQNMDGVWIETKGPILAIHHRLNAIAGPDIEMAIMPIIASLDDYKLQVGNNVIEIKPRDANKGAALIRQMDLAPFRGRRPIMIGDDTTDEDGFLAAQALGGIGVKMGRGETGARYRIDNIDQLYEILGRIK